MGEAAQSDQRFAPQVPVNFFYTVQESLTNVEASVARAGE